MQRVFFGWWIVGGAVGIQLLLSLLLLQSYGIYAVLWKDEFGWSATAIAVAYSLHRAETGLLGPLQGWFLVRFGPLRVMRIGVWTTAVGFVLLSRIQTLSAFYIAVAVLAVGGSLMGALSLMTVLVNWFDRKRSTAFALVQTGMSLGGLAVPALAAALLVFGWRSVALASGVAILLFGLPLTQLMRGGPENYGLQPDGARRRAGDAQPSSRGPMPTVSAEFTAHEALRTRAFWLLSIGHALAVSVVSVVLVHLVLHLTEDLGISVPVAAGAFALMTGCTIIGQLLGGILGDRSNKRLLAVAGMIGHAVAMVILALANTLLGVLCFAVVHGLSWGARGPLMSALRADYFGRKSFPMIMGYSSLIVKAGSMSAPILAGIFVDTVGDYRRVFLALAISAALGAVCLVFATQPAHRT